MPPTDPPAHRRPFEDFLAKLTPTLPTAEANNEKVAPVISERDLLRLVRKLIFMPGDIVRLWGMDDSPTMKVMGFYHEVGVFEADFIRLKGHKVRTHFTVVWFDKHQRLQEMSCSSSMLELIKLGPRK